MIFLIYISSFIVLLYGISIIGGAIGFVRGIKLSKKQEGKQSAKGFYSIVIPYRNEQDTLLTCLRSIENLNYPKDQYEVILVNDHSEDNGPSQVINFIEEHPTIKVQSIELTGDEGKKSALSAGILLSKYDVIVTTDADCVVPEDWLLNLNQSIEFGADMVISPVVFSHSGGLLANFQQLDLFALQGVGLGGACLGFPTMSNGANLSFRKSSFKEVGGYDDHNTPSGDDVFLMEKFKANKKQIVASINKGSVVETTQPSTWRAYFLQRIRWASKSKYYRGFNLLYLSFLVVFTNFLMLFFYSGALLVEKYGLILGILALSKWLIDFILLFLVASFYEDKKSLWYFIPVQLIYPFYVLAIWIASMTSSYNWKGRTYNG